MRQRGQIDWLVVGGQSGLQARPCHVECIRNIVHQANDAGLPVNVKR